MVTEGSRDHRVHLVEGSRIEEGILQEARHTHREGRHRQGDHSVVAEVPVEDHLHTLEVEGSLRDPVGGTFVEGTFLGVVEGIHVVSEVNLT